MRTPVIRFMLLVASTFSGFSAQPPIQSAPAASQPHSQYFSGYVAAMTGDSLTVTRKSAPGHDTLRKVFVMDPQTKVEGKLHLNARVTVRFESGPAGERAVRIIVRG